MASQSQIDANRANAAKSCGPATPEGKQRTSWNALRHGFTGARSVVLSNEDPQRFQELLDSYLLEYQPVGQTETHLVYDLVQIRWRLSRLDLIENAVIDLRMDAQQNEVSRAFARPDEPARSGMAWSAEANNSQALSLLNRYQARLGRAWHRALNTLQRLQSSRCAAAKPARKNSPARIIKFPNKANFSALYEPLPPGSGNTAAPEELK